MTPNILLLLADELRADTLGAYGHPLCQTPHLDALAASGTRFVDCVVTQPTCTPSRASILTGAYPSALRTRMVGCRTPDDPRFLGHRLGAVGYRTASIGKIHLLPQSEEPLAVQTAREAGGAGYYGFDEVDLVNGHGDRCFGADYERHVHDNGASLAAASALSTAADVQLSPTFGPHPFRLPASLHSSQYIADRAIDFIDAVAGGPQPFFAHVSFPDPHHPFTVPEPWASMYAPAATSAPIPHAGRGMPACYEAMFRADDTGQHRMTGTPPLDYANVDAGTWQAVRARYYGMTSCLDHHVGRILEHLQTTGLRQNTVVVFVSDHGDYLGDHGFVGKGLHFDPVLRVPLIVSGPAIAIGGCIQQPASTLDLAPTLLELAGVDPGEGVQGVSCAAALRGDGDYTRTAALTENDDDRMPVRMRTLTTTDWRFTVRAGSEEGELYDRRADPTESTNRFTDPSFADVRRDLQAVLLEELLCAYDNVNGSRQSPAPSAKHWAPSHNR